MDKTYFNREKGNVGTSPFRIFINQAGYAPSAVKTAVMPFECSSFAVVDINGNKVYEGVTESLGYDSCSGDNVWRADFSALKETGIYRIISEGEKSAGFSISEGVYEKPLNDMLRAFYFLRCGTGLDDEHAGVYRHGRCHDTVASEWFNHDIKKDVCGGWHDAGDYGRYVTAGACALAHLLYAYLLFPKLRKTDMNIPESKNGIPDILNECRIELEWIMKMQKEDGGVYHKATTAQHAPFVMPEDDRAELYLLPVSSMATADTAAICAMASRIYNEYDKDFSERLRNTAEKAYEWLEKNPCFLPFSNPEGCNTGGYGEHEDRSNRYWAAAEMYALTSKEKYHGEFKRLMEEDFNRTNLGYADVGGFGSLTYIMLTDNADSEICEKLKAEFIGKAFWLKELADNSGYGVAMAAQDYGWGSNMAVMKRGMHFILADMFMKKQTFKTYTQRLADYLLGSNPLGISYLSGTGSYRINYPHLRPAHADGIEECIPGMVSGGANRTPNDPDARLLIPEGTPPMKCFADDVGCYSLNEITIYWNSPAVFVFSYLI